MKTPLEQFTNICLSYLVTANEKRNIAKNLVILIINSTKWQFTQKFCFCFVATDKEMMSKLAIFEE
jgi:hypothetical protein